MTSTRATWGLRLFYFLFFVSLGTYSPNFPRWLEAQGIRGFELGVVAATSPIMGLVSPPVFGWLADRTGLRRGVIALTTWCAAVAVGVLAVLTGRGATGFVVTLACVAIFSFFRAPMGSLADTIALESGAPYGPMRLWGSVGFLVAAVIAGRTLDPTSPRLLVAIAAALVAAGLAALLLEPSRPRGASSGPATSEGRGAFALLREDPGLRALLASAWLIDTAHSAYDLCYSLHLRDEGVVPSMVGVLWALGVLVEVLFFLAAEWLLARWGAGRLLVVGAASLVLRLGAMAELHGLAALVGLQALHALTFGASWTALMRFVREQGRPESLGALRGLLSATAAIGGASGMVAWGACYRAYGGAVTFRAAAVVGLMATSTAFTCARRFAEGSRRAALRERAGGT